MKWGCAWTSLNKRNKEKQNKNKQTNSNYKKKNQATKLFLRLIRDSKSKREANRNPQLFVDPSP